MRDCGQAPLPEFFRWARQLCRAISQIHQYRIVHRDISATNIWLDARDVTHLGDFDTAFFLEDPQVEAQDFSTTEGYPAPNCWAGRLVTSGPTCTPLAPCSMNC
jgi:serine/threonine protein kinase